MAGKDFALSALLVGLFLACDRALGDEPLTEFPSFPLPAYLMDDSSSPTAPSTPPSSPAPRLRSYELPPVNVVGQRPSDLREEDRVGSYAQPRWTATRRLPNTPRCVVPQGQVGTELVVVPRLLENGQTNGPYLRE